jgi:hypothetical protein
VRSVTKGRRVRKVNGQEVSTISDAALSFGVTPKTVNQWIAENILEEPPTVAYGTGWLRVFPEDYMKRQHKRIEARRTERRKR